MKRGGRRGFMVLAGARGRRSAGGPAVTAGHPGPGGRGKIRLLVTAMLKIRGLDCDVAGSLAQAR